MSLFTVTDVDKRVYEEQLKDFLPDKMIDIHTHIWRLERSQTKPRCRKKEKGPLNGLHWLQQTTVLKI